MSIRANTMIQSSTNSFLGSLFNAQARNGRWPVSERKPTCSCLRSSWSHSFSIRLISSLRRRSSAADSLPLPMRAAMARSGSPSYIFSISSIVSCSCTCSFMTRGRTKWGSCRAIAPFSKHFLITVYVVVLLHQPRVSTFPQYPSPASLHLSKARP